MPKHAHYDQEDVLVRYKVQSGKCACSAALFPSYHISSANPAEDPHHPCNLVLLCTFCGDAHDESEPE